MFRYLFSLILSLAAYFTNNDVIVQTKYGTIQGVQTSKSRAFLGVPYAAPPVGTMRWRPPENPSTWSGILDTTTVKAGCYQIACAAMNPSVLCPKEVSEDCLYLNIWTPVNASAESRLPVMVFIHGGNFVQLSGGSLLFRGEDFVSKGHVILVNVDYRLGVFGFLVTGNKDEDAKGNYGIKDQRLALQWVQENIQKFGGDPKKVTLFGQSAGAQSTAIHLSNGKANGLFHNAIVESAPFDIRYKTKEEVLFLGDFIAKFVNCTGGDIACLRTRSATDIALGGREARTVVTSPFLLEFFEPIGPWIDGDEVKMEPISSAQKGQFQNIPVLIGTVSEETRIYVYEAWKKPLGLEMYLGIALLADPLKSLQILDKYPPNNLTDCRDTLVELSTDLIFICTARNVTQSLQKFAHSSLYLYNFNHAFSFKGAWDNFTFCEGHVCHGSELPYLFHTAHLAGYHLPPEEEQLSTELISYWSNFAYTSNPNAGPHTIDLKWPNYSSKQKTIMHFQTPQNELISEYRKEFCDFWDTEVGYFI